MRLPEVAAVALPLALLLASTALFAAGFFPGGGGGEAGEEKEHWEQEQDDCLSPHSSPPSHIVFMVIDAWRLGFLTQSDTMSFIRSSVSAGIASLFDAHVQSPTVTMPRIKAMTAGSVPSFAAVVSNLASGAAQETTWVGEYANKGKRIHFFGDDTWLHLFPTPFQKADGVTSFFVKDYTEVDRNVTRHLTSALSEDGMREWDMMILHYLGLDHIGHSLGGESAQIPVKLREMDGVVRRIHDALSSLSPSHLLVVVGDHGMTPAGGHGGASTEETRVPVVVWRGGEGGGGGAGGGVGRSLLSPTQIEQVDVASTLASLLGVELPASLGVDLSGVLEEEGEAMRRQLRTARRFERMGGGGEGVSLCIRELSVQVRLGCEGLARDGNRVREVMDRCSSSLRSSQSTLIARSAQVSLPLLLAGSALSAVATLLLLRSSLPSLLPLSPSTAFFSLCLLVKVVSTFASSLVEEEHEIWYFLFSTFVAVHMWSGRRVGGAGLALLLLHRLGMAWTMSARRRWTMTEDTLAPATFHDASWLSASVSAVAAALGFPHVPDPATLIASSPALRLLSLFLSLYCLLDWRGKDRWVRVGTAGAAACLLERMWRGDDVTSVHHLWFVCLLLLPSSPGNVLRLILCSLHRLQFLPLLAISRVMGGMGRGMGVDQQTILLATVWWYQGNSNSLSSLDVASGYTGISSYQPLVIAIQMTLHCYSTVIVAAMESHLSFSSLLQLLLLRAVSLCSSQLALLLFSHHLFVWSVFAPKCLYESAHLLFISLTSAFVCFIRTFSRG